MGLVDPHGRLDKARELRIIRTRLESDAEAIADRSASRCAVRNTAGCSRRWHRWCQLLFAGVQVWCRCFRDVDCGHCLGHGERGHIWSQRARRRTTHRQPTLAARSLLDQWCQEGKLLGQIRENRFEIALDGASGATPGALARVAGVTPQAELMRDGLLDGLP